MVSLLFYESTADAGPTVTRDGLEDHLAAAPGVELDGAWRAAYRSGRWRDPATGASCTIDLGNPPIDDDPLHPPRTYDGWREAGLTIGIPLSGPHWLCVEALQFVEAILHHLPHLRALDSEDTERGTAEGPGTWNRPRVLASWERQHAVQYLGRTDAWRMNRLSSVCVWRYRRERAAGSRDHPALQWPEALALLDNDGPVVRSGAFWHDPSVPLALPPVEVLVIAHGPRSGVLIAADLALAANPTPLSLANAAVIEPSAATLAVFTHGVLLPISRFRALGDLDWSD
jgi:hypothetical protein